MSKGITILAVDDSMLTRVRYVAQPLRAAGYEVIEAANGREGLDAFEKHRPDCVVSDLLMPVMDGFDFVKALRDSGHTTPIIVASADIQKASRERVEAVGVSCFLNKPFDKEMLLEAVSAALEDASQQETVQCS